MERNTESQLAARERLELYCMAHPGTPTAIRRPQLHCRGGVWMALLGDSIESGIVGFGSTVEAALTAFDLRYLNALRAPHEQLGENAQALLIPRHPSRKRESGRLRRKAA